MAVAEDIEDFDPGLARERTELAWTRTAISFAALGGAFLRSLPFEGAVVLAFSVLIWRIGRSPRGLGAGTGNSWRALLITATITGIALVTLVLTYVGPMPAGLGQ